jgi:hypothetical protein
MIQIARTTFYEKINVAKLNYIINNPAKYEKQIKKQEKAMRRLNKHYNAFAALQKMRENVTIPKEFKGTEFGLLKITYKKGKNSNGIGRWYANDGVGIQPLCTCVRHTICQDIWVDIDQVNSHPTILSQLMRKHNFTSPLLDECIENREVFFEKVMKDENCERDDAKTLIIAVINGGSYKSPTLSKLANELKPALKFINNLPEYASISEFVKKTYKENENVSGKIISRILQVIENDLLEFYVNFFSEKGLIVDNYIALIFDGFQLLKNEAITQELLDECVKAAYDTLGYVVLLKVKPFGDWLDLPENYADCEDDLPSLINKYNIGLNEFIDNNSQYIETAVKEDGSHTSISIVTKKLFDNSIVYDAENELWFYCNTNNIWKKSNKPIILKGLLSTVVSDIFKLVAYIYTKKAMEEETDDGTKEILTEKSKKSLSIALKLHNSTFLKSITDTCQINFNKDKFYESKIDSLGYLFAFSDKVLDCNTLEVRSIEPEDYIMTNTGYSYPQYVDEECKTIIEKYYNTIYPDEDVKNYMWNNDALTLYGERKIQTFNIHTGSGSNSKSTKIIMMKSAIGEYFAEINAETFTRPPRSANATSELYVTKGKRLVFFNEPENDADNKLQVGLFKKMADGYKGTLKARGLYADMIEFPIFFRVEGACNNKPTLSSVDGGIGRRVRIVNYPVKFIDEPDVNNKYQALLNPEMAGILSSEKLRNTYIRMLIDRFVNVASKITKENVPTQIKDDSNEYIQDCNEVLGFILDGFEVTNNENDKIPSSFLSTSFKSKTNSKMTASKFKDDMLGISGITFKKMKNGNYFIGLKAKPEIMGEEEN